MKYNRIKTVLNQVTKTQLKVTKWNQVKISSIQFGLAEISHRRKENKWIFFKFKHNDHVK